MATALSTLRTRSKTRSDMTDSSFVSDAEWLEFINESYYELYDILIAHGAGEDYFETTDTSKTTVVDQEDYALPTDFYKLIDVDIQSDGDSDDWLTMIRTTKGMRNTLRNIRNHSSSDWWNPPTYELRGGNIRLLPAPGTAGRTIRIRYIPTLTALALDADEIVDLPPFRHWESYIVITAAMKAKLKQEEDVTFLLQEKQSMETRIRKAALNRDQHMPQTISRSRHLSR